MAAKGQYTTDKLVEAACLRFEGHPIVRTRVEGTRVHFTFAENPSGTAITDVVDALAVNGYNAEVWEYTRCYRETTKQMRAVLDAARANEGSKVDDGE
jgi:hypothetical protein